VKAKDNKQIILKCDPARRQKDAEIPPGSKKKKKTRV